ncbi:MAG: nitrous oxide reductase accessory protein NosL [Phycisphaerae bacterium]|nr:nitrous oxide reductase accessory protein NosL [Phycisphaerae bacterium]
MKPAQSAFALLGLALAAALGGCEPAIEDGPPKLRLGRDECTECGMSIVEGKSSAATVATIDGQRAELLWDDIGCMLDWERDNPAVPVLARYVHDHGTEAWTDALTAHFVLSPKIITPMASGLVAFEFSDSAQAAHAANGGVVLSWGDLAQARTAWLRSQGRLSSP